MTLFLTLMVVGLIGMVMMALPGLMHHGHGGDLTHGAHDLHADLSAGAHGGHGGHGAPASGHGHSLSSGIQDGFQWTRLIPSPRVIFTLMTLYGAFGYGLVGSAHLTPAWAGLIAAIPALLLERFAVNPLWKQLMRFDGIPSSPLESLVLTEAEAVTPFRNGKGMVSVVHDGRLVQLTARLPEAQAMMPVRVGDKLRIEEVDSANERVMVSVK